MDILLVDGKKMIVRFIRNIGEDLEFLSSNSIFILWNYNRLTRFVIWEWSFFSNILCYKLIWKSYLKKLNIYDSGNIIIIKQKNIFIYIFYNKH